MFEKEAKKWVKENTLIEHSASFGDIHTEPSAEKGFQKGAEFGYNKANEWHYVKDGDLPECGEYVWCLFKNAQFPFIAKLYFGMADNGLHWKCLTTNEEYYEGEVYAWCYTPEPPERPKESE